MDKTNKGKFKKGKWFRLNNFNNMVGRISESGFVLFFDVYDFTKSLTPEPMAYVDYPKGYGDTYTDLILTPSEALILLAHGFVLIQKIEGYLVKINSDGLLLNKRPEDINWEVCFLSDYSDFKIHALPEGIDGN